MTLWAGPTIWGVYGHFWYFPFYFLYFVNQLVFFFFFYLSLSNLAWPASRVGIYSFVKYNRFVTNFVARPSSSSLKDYRLVGFLLFLFYFGVFNFE